MGAGFFRAGAALPSARTDALGIGRPDADQPFGVVAGDQSGFRGEFQRLYERLLGGGFLPRGAFTKQH